MDLLTLIQFICAHYTTDDPLGVGIFRIRGVKEVNAQPPRAFAHKSNRKLFTELYVLAAWDPRALIPPPHRDYILRYNVNVNKM